jgi:hypothetical protein
MTSWTVTTANDTAMTAYIAMRLAQDKVTVTLDQAIAELLMIGGINQSATKSGPTVKNHGNRFS